MATFWSIARNEARQLWRRRSFWVIQVLLLLISPLVGLEPQTGFTSTLVLLYLVLPILAGPALLRDTGKPGEIVWSTPTGALTHYAGVIAGLWLGLAPGALLQVSGWFIADLFFPNSFSFWIWPVGLALLLLANTVGLFLTALLAMLVRRMAPLLILWTALWLWLWLDVIFSAALAEGFMPMQAKIYNNLFFQNLPFSPSLGLGLSTGKVLGMAAWFLGLGLLAASLGLGVSLFVDRRRALRRVWILPGLVLAGALAAWGGYAVNTRAAAAYTLEASPYDPQIDVWEVDSQQTSVDVNASTGVISGTSRLRLTADKSLEKPEVVLRLNPGLDLVYVRDGSGGDLPVRRLGDSVVIGLPVLPVGTVPLDLAWQGRLKISYLSFEQQWRFSNFPDGVNYIYMPLPLKALATPQGGFLLRDGDWMPWPWSSTPHQAGQSSLTLRPAGGEAAAAIPLDGGEVTFEGALPRGLLAFLPSKQTRLGSATLAVSPLAGSQVSARLGLFGRAAGQLASLLGEPPPRYHVIAPYLNEVLWSGDLLLIPDGSGFYLSNEIYWVFREDVTGSKQQRMGEIAFYLLARDWLHNHFAQPPLPFRPVLLSPGKVSLEEVPEERWYQENGHWLQLAEVEDVAYTWTPRSNYRLLVPGEQSALGFWLAMELADEETRQEDLDLLTYFKDVGQVLTGYSDRYGMINDLRWPYIMNTRGARELILALHDWAIRVGPEKAVDLAIEVVKGSDRWNLQQILSEFGARSGVPIEEGR